MGSDIKQKPDLLDKSLISLIIFCEHYKFGQKVLQSHRNRALARFTLGKITLHDAIILMRLVYINRFSLDGVVKIATSLFF